MTVEGVANYLGMRPVPDPSSPDGIHLQAAVDAANAMAPRLCPAIRALVPPAPWPADAYQGMLMLAGRLWERRNSVAGVQAFTEMGPSYVARYDPDIERLLGVGPWLPPAVA